MGSVVMLFIVMLLIAAFAFAPLGYFIYKYTQGNSKPFGDTEPHGDSESKVLDLAEIVISKVKDLLGKK